MVQLPVSRVSLAFLVLLYPLWTSGAYAEPTSTSRLITTGTGGGPNPRAYRAQSSNVLMVRVIPYLLDAGDGTAKRLAKAKVNFRDIGVIFITHGHADHTSGLATLLS